MLNSRTPQRCKMGPCSTAGAQADESKLLSPAGRALSRGGGPNRTRTELFRTMPSHCGGQLPAQPSNWSEPRIEGVGEERRPEACTELTPPTANTPPAPPRAQPTEHSCCSSFSCLRFE
eukprot:UN3854